VITSTPEKLPAHGSLFVQPEGLSSGTCVIYCLLCCFFVNWREERPDVDVPAIVWVRIALEPLRILIGIQEDYIGSSFTENFTWI
jgi:hypothetical protein